MKAKRLFVGMFCFLFLLSGTLIQAEEPSETLVNARKAYDNRVDPIKAKVSVDLYEKACAENPKSYEAHWELAKAIYYYGSYALKGATKKDRQNLYQKGIDMAKKAVALKADGVEGHFWLGVMYGQYGQAKGIMKSLGLVDDIQAEMETCIKLDESVECYGPYRVLGRMYYKLPGFKGGDKKKSMEILIKSINNCPSNALARLYLAETYKAAGYASEALQQCNEIRKMSVDPRWSAEHPFIVAQAQALRNNLIK